MNIFELIKTRRSIRKYKKEMPSKDLVDQVLEAGIWAPSSVNSQPWRFVVVTNEEVKKELLTEAKKSLLEFLKTDEAVIKYEVSRVERFAEKARDENSDFFYGAPAVIFSIKTTEQGSDFDFGLATQNMALCAHGNGLGTCIIGLAKYMDSSPGAREILKMKDHETLEIALILGYSDDEPVDKGRNFDVIDWIN